MAKRRKISTTTESKPVLAHEEIIDTPLQDEMGTSFLQYAMSTIVARAIPDVRDGMKPVQRRIAYTMWKMRIRPDVTHVKCSKITGECMGSYHPHGDGAIYEALVRMAQPFSVNVPLVDPHGNFGYLDLGPAASRYTEARQSMAAEILMKDITEDSVDFSATYLNDGTMEPDLLPAGFPNLLVNGAMGIAVGLATNLAPHNLTEVVGGMRWLLKQKDGLVPLTSAQPLSDKRYEALLQGLRKYILGPDFPTGGFIMGTEGADASYRTGKGRIRMRAKVHVEPGTGRKPNLLVATELPYGVTPNAIMDKVAELAREKVIDGLSDPANYTDLKKGIRIIMPVRQGVDTDKVLRKLYKLTPLETGFTTNNVALIDNQPRTMGLVEMCQYYLIHRLQVVIRRTQSRLDKALARAHILEGLLKALDAVDLVVSIIRSSDDTDSARESLMSQLDLSEIQANYVLDLPLKRIARLEVAQVRDELNKLHISIAEYRSILETTEEGETKRRGIVSEELRVAEEELGFDRRTQIIGGETGEIEEEDAEEDNEPDVDLLVKVTSDMALGVVENPKPSKKVEAIDKWLHVRSRRSIRLVTSKGRAIKVMASSIPVIADKTKPIPASEFAEIGAGERIVGILSDHPEPEGETVLIVTKKGLLKRVEFSDVQNARGDETVIIGLKEGDEVAGVVELTKEDTEAIIVASNAQALRFKVEEVAPKGRAAGGMSGIKLPADAAVIAVGATRNYPSWVIATVSDKGSAKLSIAAEVPTKGRGGSGVRVQRLRNDEEKLVLALIGQGTVLPLDKAGKEVLAIRGADKVALSTIPVRRDGAGERMDGAVTRLAWKAN